jgi:xylan 1,4-beta-xylosidase
VSVATNPILAGFFPDPSICRVGEAFYLVNSTFEFFPGLPVHRSTDLVHWELVGHVIDRDGQLDLASAAASGGLYAPTIRHHGGRFWIACTLVGQAGGHFLISAQDAAGPWSDPVWIRGTRGIDPTIFFEDNDMWIAGCRLVDPGEYQGQTEIWLSRVDPVSGRLLGPEHVLWTGAVRGAVWSEGPHLYRIGQWYYLLTAEGGTEQNHCVVVARSRNLTGPYEGCPRNPVFSHRTLGSTAHVQRVGHADLVQRADGTWWAVMLGVRTIERRHILGRETFLTPVAWEDDWPVFNPGHGGLGQLVPLGGSGESAGHAQPAARIGFNQEWLSLRAPASFAIVGDDDLVVAPGQVTLRDAATPSFLGCRLADHEVKIEVALDIPAAGVGAIEAGLALYQSPAFHLSFAVERTQHGWTARACECRDGVVVELGASPVLGVEVKEVTLRARVAGSTVCFELVAGVDNERLVARATTSVLSTEVAGGFVGTVVGPYAVALAAGDAPDVRFTAFRYEPAGVAPCWPE